MAERHAQQWYKSVPTPNSQIMVSWQTPEGLKGMSICKVDDTGKLSYNEPIPNNALLFGWVYAD